MFRGRRGPGLLLLLRLLRRPVVEADVVQAAASLRVACGVLKVAITRKQAADGALAAPVLDPCGGVCYACPGRSNWSREEPFLRSSTALQGLQSAWPAPACQMPERPGCLRWPIAGAPRRLAASIAGIIDACPMRRAAARLTSRPAPGRGANHGPARAAGASGIRGQRRSGQRAGDLRVAGCWAGGVRGAG